MLAEPGIQVVRDVRRRLGHRVREFDQQAFHIGEYTQIIAGQGEKLLVSQSCFSANGRIDVYSKRTADPGGGAHLGQLNVAQRDSPFPAQASLHRNGTPDQPRQTHLHLRRGELFVEHLAHQCVEPAQMPGRLLPL